MTPTQKLLTVDELADRFQVRPGTIRLWAREGLIPVLRVGGQIVRFDFDDVLGTLKRQQQEMRADA